ncbi:MAG: rhodanese-like domain-containing protein [Myxococcales bacterium]|nr:rhodanese-like domain-containing protein [Myxococcales bacterium]
MTRLLRTRLSLLTVVFALLGLGCGGQEEATSPATEAPAAAAEAAPIRELDVDAAAALFEAGSARPVDANHQETRDSLGTVPNAVLLSSSSQYELTELPADGLLVFYCGSTQCTASDNAATRAREAGREVAVMRPGIRGWVDAGKPVANRAQPSQPEAGEGAEQAPAADEAAAG